MALQARNVSGGLEKRALGAHDSKAAKNIRVGKVYSSVNF